MVFLVYLVFLVFITFYIKKCLQCAIDNSYILFEFLPVHRVVQDNSYYVT